MNEQEKVEAELLRALRRTGLTWQAIADEMLRAKEAGGQFAVAGELLAEAFKAVTVLGANVLFVLTSIGREMGAIGALAAAGRTIFLSSHLMSEMEETADHVIVIGRGRLIADTSIAEFTQRSQSKTKSLPAQQSPRVHRDRCTLCEVFALDRLGPRG